MIAFLTHPLIAFIAVAVVCGLIIQNFFGRKTITKRIFAYIGSVLFILLAWAPWMGKDSFDYEAAKSCATAPENSFVYIGHYQAPFGRWTVTCSGSWYSLFNGRVWHYVTEK